MAPSGNADAGYVFSTEVAPPHLQILVDELDEIGQKQNELRHEIERLLRIIEEMTRDACILSQDRQVGTTSSTYDESRDKLRLKEGEIAQCYDEMELMDREMLNLRVARTQILIENPEVCHYVVQQPVRFH